MTDRELLELAAKAAGMPATPKKYAIPDHLPVCFTYEGKEWNPLTDDGDALRLAVKLGITPEPGDDRCSAEWWWGPFKTTRGRVFVATNSDPYAATRRAIVRAAAEIGRSM